jgi:HK97 family phage prohead protease
MDTLFKTFSADVKALPDSRTIKFLISTDAVDRDGDSIDPKGWDVASYKKNPIVLWSHDYSGLPVAKAIGIEQTKNGLAATAEFPAKGIHPFADTVYELLKGGFLGATSVGFKPIKHEKATDREKGMNYFQQELLEFSIVPIPANPEALVQMSIDRPEHKGLLKPLIEWSEKLLGEYYGERGVWLPASQVEKTFEAINKAQLLVKTPNPHKGSDGDYQSTATSTGDTKEPDSVSVVDTFDVEEPLFLDIEEELIDIERDQLAAHVREVTMKALHFETERAVMHAVNYARGRVS